MDKALSTSKIRIAILSAMAGTMLGACADLAVTDVHDESYLTTARAVRVTVKNQGSAGAAASSTRVEIKPAGASAFTRSSVVSTPAIAAGQQKELFPAALLYSTDYPAAGSGQCLELRACADSTNSVSEGLASEANNCLTKSICR